MKSLRLLRVIPILHRERLMITYSDLIQIPTFEERVAFLRTDQQPSEFDRLRPLNQKFYNSTLWKRVRQIVIARDLGFDLAIPGREILGRVIVHHINPLMPKDLYLYSERALNPVNLVTVSHGTHLAIHFGIIKPELPLERSSGDTKLW